mgnify:CR=1 FL=1
METMGTERRRTHEKIDNHEKMLAESNKALVMQMQMTMQIQQQAVEKNPEKKEKHSDAEEPDNRVWLWHKTMNYTAHI